MANFTFSAGTELPEEACARVPTVNSLCQSYSSFPSEPSSFYGSKNQKEVTRDRRRQVRLLRDRFIRKHGNVEPISIFEQHSVLGDRDDELAVLMLAYPHFAHLLLDIMEVFRRVDSAVDGLPGDQPPTRMPDGPSNALEYITHRESISEWVRRLNKFLSFVDSQGLAESGAIALATDCLFEALEEDNWSREWVFLAYWEEGIMHIAPSSILLPQGLMNGLVIRVRLIQGTARQLVERERLIGEEETKASETQSADQIREVEGLFLGVLRA